MGEGLGERAVAPRVVCLARRKPVARMQSGGRLRNAPDYGLLLRSAQHLLDQALLLGEFTLTGINA